MKIKMILLIVGCAIITLSFTFAATRNNQIEVQKSPAKSVEKEPIGGFVSEERL